MDVLLNVNVYDLISHFPHKVATTFFVSGYTVAPPTISVCLHAEYFMGNFKSRYLQYEVTIYQFCVQVVTLFNPVTSDVPVSCYYFELDEYTNAKLNTHLKYVVSEGYVVSEIMFIFKDFTFYYFCHCEFICYNMHLSSFLCVIPCFVELPPDLFCDAAFNYTWGATVKITF